MSFTSILDLGEAENGAKIKPAFFNDLNLDKVLDNIQYQWVSDIKTFYYYFPVDKKCEAYRRDIYSEVKKPQIFKALMDYVNCMRERKSAFDKKEQVEIELQKAVWHLWEIYYYCKAFENLNKNLKEANVKSDGFISLSEFLDNYESSPELSAMKEEAYALHDELCGFKLILTFENNIISLSEGKPGGEYEKFLDNAFHEHKEQLKSPFLESLHLSNLEVELINVFKKKNPEFFKKLVNFYEKYEIYADEILLRFDREIGFYLSFYKFQEKMQSAGFEFTKPTTDEEKELSATGVYDLALACTNMKIGKEVVANDMLYGKDEQFFVVTGPNQGGKTTFARSLGQLIYLAKMGLDVPAVSANIHYFSNILTHFSVEESIATGRGKLKEELDRLAPMMCAEYENAFVIINELFTTAANYDACIMGKRVLGHFIKQHCRGIYVTHLKELSEGNSSVVSLKALVEEHKENNRTKAIRKYKILRSPAEDMGYADDLVDKHGLSYGQLKERLKKGDENESSVTLS